MSIYNRVAFMTSLIGGKITKKNYPLMVVINITSKCNLQCGYCYGQYYQSRKPDFTSKELLNLIDDLGKMGTRSITLAGGEPLSRKDIGEVIKRVKMNGIECGMNTNGILIPQKLDDLKEIDMVTVSLDGPKEMNDQNRGEGSFKKIMTGINVALKAGIKTHLNAVITRYNWQAIDWLVDLAKNKGVQVEFNFLFQQPNGKTNSERFLPEDKQMRQAARRIVELKKQGAPILFSAKVYQMVADWPDYRKHLFFKEEPDFSYNRLAENPAIYGGDESKRLKLVRGLSNKKLRAWGFPQDLFKLAKKTPGFQPGVAYIPCYAGQVMMFIDADGKVYPCMQLIGRFKAFDFRQAGIKKAWKQCANHPCRACYFPCFNEFSAIAGFDREVILNQITSTIKGQ